MPQRGHYLPHYRLFEVGRQVDLTYFLGLSESALRIVDAALRRLVEPHERLLEVDRQADLAVLVGNFVSLLRLSVATSRRLLEPHEAPLRLT